MTSQVEKIQVCANIDYEVSIGVHWEEVLRTISARHEKVVLIAPPTIDQLFLLSAICKESSIALFLTPEGESQKDIDIVHKIWEFLGEIQADRTSAIVGMGGGATTDLAGFVAATWLRGIAWYALPTTLAGMVDAAVGGKTGINTASGKNLVGSFYSPRSVEIDLKFLETLSDRDFSAGLAEVIKCGFIRDATIIDDLEKSPTIKSARSIALELVTKSVQVKADVVSVDFTESRLREILNFGHTFGHAVEKHSQYKLRHGEAVAIGLHFAFVLSEKLLDLDAGLTTRLCSLLKSFQLPTTIAGKDYPWPSIVELMLSDKKTRNGSIRFIGLNGVESTEWLENVDQEILHEVYERIST
jgi:3-dehydroquinate synthase